MILEVSGVGAPPGFHVWAPFANLRALDLTSGERHDSGAAYPGSQSRGGGGRGARGLGHHREFSN